MPSTAKNSSNNKRPRIFIFWMNYFLNKFALVRNADYITNECIIVNASVLVGRAAIVGSHRHH